MDLDDQELRATRIMNGADKTYKRNRNIEEIISNLKRYINSDEIYTRYKNGEYNELSDFELFCINHCKDIEVVLGNLDILCDMQKTADRDLENARQINEEHRKENGLLREKIKELEEIKIIQDKNIRKGKPVIAGTRLTVIDVLLFMTEFIKEHEKEFREKYADINSKQIITCINYLLKNSIPKQKIEYKIAKLNKKEEELQNSITEEEREEYSDANISFQLCGIEIRKEVLKEILQESEDK